MNRIIQRRRTMMKEINQKIKNRLKMMKRNNLMKETVKLKMGNKRKWRWCRRRRWRGRRWRKQLHSALLLTEVLGAWKFNHHKMSTRTSVGLAWWENVWLVAYKRTTRLLRSSVQKARFRNLRTRFPHPKCLVLPCILTSQNSPIHRHVLLWRFHSRRIRWIQERCS